MTRHDNYTTDMESTINSMMDHFVPEDSVKSDGEHHKRIRQQVLAAFYTTDDEELKKQEIWEVVETFDPSKSPGEDALNIDVLLHTFKSFRNFLTEIYNKCLRRGHFPKQWKRSILIGIVKPGKEECNEANKY
jgi:hypothetical protein